MATNRKHVVQEAPNGAKAAQSANVTPQGVTGDTGTIIDTNMGVTVGETVIERRKDQGDQTKSRGPVQEVRRIFTDFAEDTKAVLQRKAEVLTGISQKLALAADLYAEGDVRHQEAVEVAGSSAVSLYLAHVQNVLSKEDVSSVLRDQFGAKKKGGGGKVSPSDPEASKTPFGKGEDIRKRVIRAADAYNCANGGDGGRFFDGLTGDSADKDGTTIKELLLSVETGGTSIWSAYEGFAAIKRNHQEKTEMAFDPAKISAIVHSLSGDGATAIIDANPALKAAYAALMEQLILLDQPVGEGEALAA